MPIVVPDVGGGGGSVTWLSFRSPRGTPAWPAHASIHICMDDIDKLIAFSDTYRNPEKLLTNISKRGGPAGVGGGDETTRRRIARRR